MATILVVEDDGDTRDAFVVLLEDAGYRVETAANGREALERLQLQRPSAIVADLIMPVMNGFDLLAALQKDHRLAEVPVVITTAACIQDFPNARAVLHKPFDWDELLLVLDEAQAGR